MNRVYLGNRLFTHVPIFNVFFFFTLEGWSLTSDFDWLDVKAG